MKYFVLLVIFLIYNLVTYATNVSTDESGGDWNTASVWSTDIVPVSDSVADDWNATISQDDIITIPSGDTAWVWDLGLNQDALVNVHGVLIIYNNLNVNNSAFLNVTGEIQIKNDVVFKNSSTLDIDNTGNVDVLGDVDTKTGSTLEVDGTLAVGGDLTGNATVNGTGTVTVDGSVDGSIKNNGPLPIDLTYFKAAYIENSVTIYWQTATEEKNDYFTLERSKDGINYTSIATIKGAGYSYSNLNYSYTDDSPLQGISYYRLMQTDYDGAFEIFDPVSVAYINDDEFKIGPNPAQNYINVSIVGEMGESTISIYNAAGAVVKTIDLQSNYSRIDINDLDAGAYLLIVNAGETNISRRIIKQ